MWQLVFDHPIFSIIMAWMVLETVIQVITLLKGTK